MAFIEMDFASGGSTAPLFTTLSSKVTGTMTATKDYKQMLIITWASSSDSKSFTKNGTSYSCEITTEKIGSSSLYFATCIIDDVKTGDVINAPSTTWSFFYFDY